MAQDVWPGLGTYTDPTADTLDLITLAEAKAAVNMASVSTWDSELATYVTAVSRRFDDLCGPIVQRTITAELHNGGTEALRLRYWPVVSVTSVTEYAYTTGTALAAETNTTKTAADYLLDAESGLLYRRSSGSSTVFATGGRNVAVTYVAGRYSNTATVGRQFKQAAIITLANIWRKEQGGGTETFGTPTISEGTLPGFAIPNAALDLIGLHRRPLTIG